MPDQHSHTGVKPASRRVHHVEIFLKQMKCPNSLESLRVKQFRVQLTVIKWNELLDAYRTSDSVKDSVYQNTLCVGENAKSLNIADVA